ncbi:sigma-70 family RNA polymerase sigma factor [Flavobacteriaceae bacterium 3-367]|uniref:RNA polymerase sigma factor n=1 Tax=Eudoraea algarum TaxID=3417568 RepID=UPI00328D9930
MGNTNKTFDGLLVLQYQSGDKKALSLLVKRYHLRLCRHAFWYTRDMDAAKDIVQDCWSVMVNKLSNIKDPNSFGSWATKIVTRKSLDYLNRNKRTREHMQSYAKLSETDGSYEEGESDRLKLQNGIRLLPGDQQMVLRLFYTQEYSLREISDILNISVGTVKSRLFHAREKLKTILKTNNDEKRSGKN